MSETVSLRQREFDSRQKVRELRRAVFEDNRLEAIPQLALAERELDSINKQRVSAEAGAAVGNGKIVSVKAENNLLGPNTTGIEVDVALRMASVPTALVHLFQAQDHPLIAYRIRNNKQSTKRLRLISYVEEYSARAVDTVEAEYLQPLDLRQIPTFFPHKVAVITELTRATVNVEIQDLDASTEIHKTVPVWLLPRSTAPLAIQDPSTGEAIDLTKYLGAYVTPNAPAILRYLRIAVGKHPQGRLVGYQVDEVEVTGEVKAIYEALRESAIKYINSVIDFTPASSDMISQRVRLPAESLESASANCIDGTVLMASLLEAASLNPAIVIIPGHAFLGWETWENSNRWRYLETTMLSTHSFDDACARGDQVAASWLAQDAERKLWKRMALRELRADGITPLQ